MHGLYGDTMKLVIMQYELHSTLPIGVMHQNIVINFTGLFLKSNKLALIPLFSLGPSIQVTKNCGAVLPGT